MINQEYIVKEENTGQIPICLSSKFMIGRKPYWNRNLFMAGCRSISDFYNAQRDLMSFEEFRSVYPQCLNALTCVALRHLVQKTPLPNNVGDKKPIGPLIHPALLQILNSRCRRYYDASLKARYERPDSLLPSQMKWKNIFNSNIPWGEIYHRYPRCSRNTALIWF